MDIQRSILFVALAVVSYLLVLQWNQDYGQPVVPPAAVASSVPALPAGEAPTANADIPSASSQGNAPVAPAITTSTADNLIRVRTDVLELDIDPQGGDIVQLKLPQYPRSLQNRDVPFSLFDNGTERTYVAQSGLVGDGPDARSSGRPLYSATSREYQLRDGEDRLVVELTFSEGGVDYLKQFVFQRGVYTVEVGHRIVNGSDRTWSGNVFAQLKRDNSGDPSQNSATGMATYLGAALWTHDEPYKKVSLGDMDDKNLRETVQGGWIAWLQHYFVTAWVPSSDDTHQVTTRKDGQGNYIIGLVGPQLNIPTGSSAETRATLYAGPKIQDDLKALSPGLELTVDYGFLWFIAQPIFWLLQVIHSLLGNWGWSIILLTVLIKLAFFPLSGAGYRSMARMRAMAPKLQALKEQHGEDRQKMSQAMMELYKKEKINPLGGCLPILVQMPVFLALYWVLLESVEIRQAPWLGWIVDLSIKDPYFILPIIMGATMFFQQTLNPTPPDPMQARVLKLMPIVFTFFFLWFPAGLVLYWVVNNILSIGQQWYITRQIEAAAHKA
ncbi:membrane protein insertase YidC [Pseudomonas sp. NW5]|uniref:membrane protein insertase YidC n=1 Tax=Pseudomonas sp. NW5 TaxID=2934934 RepID=UPI002021965D|nr:membrane protein insertase YidC [Pseudomonas sp. NW5]MCL7461420.1 membrane protein insertase YidC [Pseudomonas sp. NW5]